MDTLLSLRRQSQQHTNSVEEEHFLALQPFSTRGQRTLIYAPSTAVVSSGGGGGCMRISFVKNVSRCSALA
jgi:hypothetical protein